MASRIIQSFSFHQSPESFISDRLQQFTPSIAGQPLAGHATPVICAQILDRNVHIVSSYKACRAILCASDATAIASVQPSGSGETSALSQDTFAVGPAYEQLMASFFPPPNLLLEDGPAHVENKRGWRKLFEHVLDDSIPLIRELTLEALNGPSKVFHRDRQVDLYEALKELTWNLLFAIFLGLNRENAKDSFRNMESLQETVLRGQFSLFPVSVSTPLWRSARSRGLKAVRDLDPAIRSQMRARWEHHTTTKKDHPACPFAAIVTPGETADGLQLSEDDIVSNLRLFTSSIANKALASLLTAFFMNLFLWRDPSDVYGEKSLASLIAVQAEPTTRDSMLQSVLKETARLSPPVIGVMRRVTQDVHIAEGTGHDGTGHTVPVGHDAWLYFAAANRDRTIFDQPDDFCWDRFMEGDVSVEENLTFGMGPKSCLGAKLILQVCLTVAQTMLESEVSFNGRVDEDGVRQWLGWHSDAGSEAIARDLKQLPCQRPRRPIMVILQDTSTG